MSFGGGKLRPEDLFQSLAVIRKENSKPEKSVAEKFFDRFSSSFTEKDITGKLKND
jgi:hypothetical protein